MRLLLLVAIVSVALTLLWAQSALAGDVVRTPRVVSERVVDCSSIESMIAGIIKPDMTPRQKAEAVYEFVRQYRWHWCPAREGDRRDDYEYGLVYDPVKLLNVYGYGYCFQTAPMLESLYQAAGLEARGCGIGGHSIAEVYYDGQYHFYDSDQHGFCRLLDGKTVASMAQLERDPLRLVLNQPNPSEPFFPATKNPRVPYESKVLVAAYFASTKNNYTRHDKTDVGHRMDISLAPGMRYIRYFQPRGAWCYNYKDLEGDIKNGYLDVAKGPADPITGKTYGNGTLLWQPDLTSQSNEYRAGVWQDENIVQGDTGLRPAVAGKPAWAVFRVRVPYVIVGWPSSWTETKPVGAAVVRPAFAQCGAKDTRAVSVSTDNGRTWKQVWKADKPDAADPTIDLSEQVAGRYEYLLRLEMFAQNTPMNPLLSKLSIVTNFQLNPASLPAIGEGKTKMRFLLGEETETAELTADIMTGEGFLRDVQDVRDINFTPGRLRSRSERVGEIVYELVPPRPGTIVSIDAEAGCRREPGQLHYLDDVKIYYSENQPGNWKLLADDDPPPYMQHWSYFLPGQVKCSPDVRRVYVKFALRTVQSVSIQMMRMRMRWKPGQAVAGRPRIQLEQGLPVRGVRIEHGWTEGGAEKKFETIVKDAPADYVVDAGRDVVNQWIAIEPVRAPSAQWRADDPPMVMPSPGPLQLVDAKLRDEMQSLCRQIDQDPAKFLPLAAASKIDWLASGAKEALAMFKAKYPLEDPQFGQPILDRAARVLAAPVGVATSAPATQDDDEEARSPVAMGPITALTAADCTRLFVRLQATVDRGDRATLAAAMVLLGDKRGVGPLSESLRATLPALLQQRVGPLPIPNPAVWAMPAAAVLLRFGPPADPAGRQIVQRILASPNTYVKLRYLDLLLTAGLPAVPDELLVGLNDSSRWVRMDVLRLCRGRMAGSPAVRQAVARVAKDDPLPFLRDEAAGMLAPQE